MIACLATEAGLLIQLTLTESGSVFYCYQPRNRALRVVDFYLTTPWMCPGQKNVYILRDKVTAKKKKIQKQYMLTTLAEAHATFLEENADYKLSMSKFCDLHPPQVQLMKNIPHYSCLCKYHENVKLLLCSLSRAGLNIHCTHWIS